MMNDPQQDTNTQAVIYDLFIQVGNRIMGGMSPNVAMALAIYATPHVTELANKAVSDAKTAIYMLQVYFFLNRAKIYYASEDSDRINVFDSGYILNLNLGSSAQMEASEYRKSLATSVSERLIIFNRIDNNVCIVVPFIKKPLTGDLGKNVILDGFSLLVRLNSCVVKDLIRNITYTFTYDMSGLNKITYSDPKNGWHVTCITDGPPNIQKA